MRAFSRSLAVTRTLSGVDVPSFKADRIIPPVLNVISRSVNPGSAANPVRSRWAYSWADRDRSGLSWTLSTASIGPAFGVYADDQFGVSPISLTTSSRSAPSFSLTTPSTAATRSSVFSIRVPDGART